jgi:hypothetical protein
MALAAVVAAGAAFQAAPVWAAGDPIDHGAGAPDVDVRSKVVKPTAAQRSAAADLGAAMAWNRFGTPSSLVASSGSLGREVSAATAVDAARIWLDSNKALFKLSSVDDLALVGDNQLTGGAGHAVTLRQTVGGLPAADGGLVTVGVGRSGGSWRVISASSTISGDESLAGKSTLSAAEALQRAAANVGTTRSLAQIDTVSASKAKLKGWKGFTLAGVSDIQRAREVAFPTIERGYVPAYETVVVDSSGDVPSAYATVIDARTGTVLERQNLVDNATDAAAAGPTSFSGDLPTADGGCATRHGPYAVGAGTRAIDVFADAASPANDIVLKLFHGDQQVAEEDTVRTPERIRWEPEGGVPAGDYFVQLCEFGDGTPPIEPRSYTGTFNADTSAAPAPYLARWKTFPANPPLAQLDQYPWNHPSTDTRATWCWQASSNPADCDKVIGNQASRSPWDFDPKTNASTHTTRGNNARSAESWMDGGQPGQFQFQPTSAARDYSFPWTNAWNQAQCNPGTPYGSAFTVGESFDIAAATANLFVVHNQMHDWTYNLGFTEENWNGQESNYGRTEAFRENDPVRGSSQAGAATPPPGVYAASRNNANMATLPDGSSSITNMYLWQPVAGAFYPPCVDGDYDAGVIGHEYGHMVENRMIGKGSRRSGFAAGAMGEASGDLLSTERLLEYGYTPTDGENKYATGTYATGNKLRGIRNYAPNFPYTGAFPTPSTYPQIDPLNYSDVGYDLTGPEVHADGEIWVAINWEVRNALAQKYEASFPEGDQATQTQCADGRLPVERCPGNRRWIQLYLDSYLLMPTAPSMIDARNAILAADEMRFDGADTDALWAAFAKRGLGADAAGTNGSGRTAGVESDTDPLPDFAAPGARNATVTFKATDRTDGKKAPKARIYVGHYEARVSPVADTDSATSAPATAPTDNLDAKTAFAPGTYEFIATAPGYGAVRFRQTFKPGVNKTVTLQFAPNLASRSQGATASGDTAPVGSSAAGQTVLTGQQVLDRLIDDTEGTDWQAAATQQGDSWEVDGKAVTVDLAGARPQTIRRVQVSALLGPVFDAKATRPADQSQNRFTAVRQFEIWTCNDQRADCSNDDGYQRAYRSAADAFPADAPRPVAPTLLLREFAFSAVKATHVRIVVRSSQCTAGPAYQGEQDQDAANATDCNSAGPAATRFVRVAELQAFDQASAVKEG